MESNKTDDGSCISIQVSHSFQVTLKSPWVTKCSLFLLIDRSRFPRNSHSRRPDRPPLQDVPNLKKIALPVGNSLILFTFWTSNTVLGSLSAIGIWKIVWFFQIIKFNIPGKVRRVCLDRTFHQQDFPEPTRAFQIPDFVGIILNLKNTLPLMMKATFNNCVSVSWSPWCMSLRYWLSCKASAGTAVTALFNTSATSRRSWKYDCCQWKLHPVCSCQKPNRSADRVKAIQRHYDADLAESLDAENLCVRDLLVHSIS